MRTRATRGLAAVALLVVSAVAVLARPADAASGPQVFGGTTVAPFNGSLEPAIASDGTNTLVVWEKAVGQDGKADIYGRITKADTSDQQAPFRISLTADDEFGADVAFNGTSYLVVWEAVTPTGSSVIRGRRVSKTGALLGSQLTIAGVGALRQEPSVTAGANGQFVVVWQDLRNAGTTDWDIYGRRITASGGLQDGTGVRLSRDSGSQPIFTETDTVPDVAWNGRLYVAAYESYNAVQDVTSIQAAGITPGGQQSYGGNVGWAALGSTRNFSAREPSLAANNGTFFLVYSYEEPPSGDRVVFASRFDEDESQPTPFEVSGAAGEQTDPAVAFNGVFTAVWTDRRNGANDLWGARITPNGTVQDPDGFLVTEFHPENGYAAITKATSAAQTFTLAFESVPSGASNGIISAGIRPATK